MDGTLTKTEHLWMESVQELAGENWSADLEQLVMGTSVRFTSQKLHEISGIGENIDQAMEILNNNVINRMSKEPRQYMPGARELILQLADSNMKLALITSSPTMFVTPVLSDIPTGIFDVVVDGDEVSHNKPHPQPYQKALQKLDLPASNAITFEDSPPGVLSSRRAGIPTCWVGTSAVVKKQVTEQVAVLKDHCLSPLRTLPSIKGLNLERVLELFSQF